MFLYKHIKQGLRIKILWILRKNNGELFKDKHNSDHVKAMTSPFIQALMEEAITARAAVICSLFVIYCPVRGVCVCARRDWHTHAYLSLVCYGHLTKHTFTHHHLVLGLALNYSLFKLFGSIIMSIILIVREIKKM